MRTIGCVGITNSKTYMSESLLTFGYGAAKGVLDGNCTAITAAGQRGLGIVAADVASVGASSNITRLGDALAIAGGPISTGDYVKFDAVGRVVTSTAAGDEIIGRAESTAVNVGDQLIVFVMPSIR